MADDTPGLGPIVADLGANLICVLVVLIALAALRQGDPAAQPAPKATVLTETMTEAPLSGAAQSDLLHHRLTLPADWLVVDLRQAGPVAITRGGEIPLSPAALPPSLPRRAALFIFDQSAYPLWAELRRANALTSTELVVPSALRQGDRFSPAFLSLQVTDDPASIRPPLLALLTQGAKESAAEDGGAAAQASERPLTRLWEWLARAGNLLGLGLALIALRLANRWRGRVRTHYQ